MRMAIERPQHRVVAGHMQIIQQEPHAHTTIGRRQQVLRQQLACRV